jgi:trans-2-enoyl-CoA reductase
VTNIIPSRQATFGDVQKEVTDRYVAEEAARLMQDAAKAAADRAKKGEDLKLVAKSEGGELKTAAAFTIMGAAEGLGSATTVAAAFGPKAKVGDVIGPVDSSGNVYVCKVATKEPADMSKFVDSRASMVQTLKQKKGDLEGALFGDSVVTDLKKRGIIKMNQDAIQRLAASYRS